MARECVTAPASAHNAGDDLLIPEPLTEAGRTGGINASAIERVLRRHEPLPRASRTGDINADTIAAMSSRVINPDGIAPPAARYAHAVATTGAQLWLHTSGVVPTRADGSVPGDIGEQARTVWQNIAALLAEAGMAPENVVSVTTYVVPGQDLGAVMAERDQFLSGHMAASTLVVVPELAQPAWKMEIAIVAAR